MKNIKILIVALLALAVLAGCAPKEEPKEAIKAVFVVRTNLGDKSFNDSAWFLCVK